MTTTTPQKLVWPPDRSRNLGLVFVQLSDVHFGEHLFRQYYPTRGIDHRFNPPHDAGLLGPLQTAMRSVAAHAGLSSPGELPVVFGGDLTREGTPAELHVGLKYLYGVVPHPNQAGQDAGLSLERVFGVPGNHDHWRGVNPHYPNPNTAAAPSNPQLFPAVYPPQPALHDTIAGPPGTMSVSEFTNSRLCLRLYGVDSNSGTRDGWHAWSAGGAFRQGHLASLEKLIQLHRRASESSPLPCVEVLVCHHAFSSWTSTRWRDWPPAGPLDDSSTKALLDVARRKGIGVVLTGHQHSNWRQEFGDTYLVTEIRCGTALQGEAEAGHQTFLVHELCLDSQPGIALWYVYPFVFDGSEFQYEAPLLEDQTPIALATI